MSIKFNEVTWYSKLGAILLFILVVPILTFYIGRKYQEVIDIQAVDVANTSSPKHVAASSDRQGAASPLSSTYRIDDQDVTLSNGSSEQSVEGSSGTFETKLFGEPVYGDLNGDGVNDAISFLYQETPGTGIFFYVVAAINVNGSYVGTNAIFLGDRIAPQNISISKGVAAANYATRKDSDSMTTDPSVGVSRYLSVVNGALVESGSKSIGPFTAKSKTDGSKTSNIVGYFAGGSFYWYVPDWIEGNWKMTKNIENEGFTLTPVNASANRSYSDIIVAVNPSEESYNAAYLYEQHRTSSVGELVLNEVLLNKHIPGTLTMQMETNTRIYHVERKFNGQILDKYFIDGSGGKTAFIVFSASIADFPKYEAKIREMVEGMGAGIAPQG